MSDQHILDSEDSSIYLKKPSKKRVPVVKMARDKDISQTNESRRGNMAPNLMDMMDVAALG